MAINIDIAANTRQFQSSVKDVSKSLDDVADSLDDLARDSQKSADKAGDSLEKGIKDGAKDAEKAVDKLEKTFKELADEAKDTGRDIEKGIGDGTKDGTKEAGEGLEDLKDEANETAREAAASFDGSAESIVDAFQEVAANAFAGFGPAGALAGLAAAAGIGVVTSVLQQQQEEADALKEALAGAYQSAVEEGRAYLDEAQIIAGVNDILFNPDKKSIYEMAQRDAETLGVTLNDVLRAQAGDEEKINMLIEAGHRKELEIVDAKTGGLNVTTQEASELGHVVQRYDDLKVLHDENITRAERSLQIERDIKSEVSSANVERRAWDAERGKALEDYYSKASNPPQPVVRPTVDMRDVEAAFEAIRRKNLSTRVQFDYVINEHRGKQVF